MNVFLVHALVQCSTLLSAWQAVSCVGMCMYKQGLAFASWWSQAVRTWHADPRFDWPRSAAGPGRAPAGSCLTAAQSAGIGGETQVIGDPVHALTCFEAGYMLALLHMNHCSAVFALYRMP